MLPSLLKHLITGSCGFVNTRLDTQLWRRSTCKEWHDIKLGGAILRHRTTGVLCGPRGSGMPLHWPSCCQLSHLRACLSDLLIVTKILFFFRIAGSSRHWTGQYCYSAADALSYVFVSGSKRRSVAWKPQKMYCHAPEHQLYDRFSTAVKTIMWNHLNDI